MSSLSLPTKNSGLAPTKNEHIRTASSLILRLGRKVFNPLVDKGSVCVVRLYEVIVVRRAFAVNLRVAFRAVSFVPFIFAFDADDSIALIFFHMTNYVCYKFSSSNFFSRILFSGDEKQNSAISGRCPRRRNLMNALHCDNCAASPTEAASLSKSGCAAQKRDFACAVFLFLN